MKTFSNCQVFQEFTQQNWICRIQVEQRFHKGLDQAVYFAQNVQLPGYEQFQDVQNESHQTFKVANHFGRENAVEGEDQIAQRRFQQTLGLGWRRDESCGRWWRRKW